MYTERRLGSRGEPAHLYARGMIDLGSIAGLHAHNHQLHAYCPTCDRWAALPLADMIAAGQGSRRLPFTVRCRWCGAVGRLQVRPPMPMHSTVNGWPCASSPLITQR
jgi:hypothetical protein